MDESEAVEQEGIGVATPIFSVYRRGYDPEQVDRYVTDQQRRLDEALHRASESERKLAAAVGQLRELHRRVAVYESEQRTAQPPALDSLGERVQRILQEAWEGAYNLRQEAEREVTELREQTQREIEAQREAAQGDVEELRAVASAEAAELVDEATRRALALRDEMDRRRQAYLERVERDRQRAVAQITFLYDQKQLAISELARLQATVEATIEEMVRSPLGKPAASIADAAEARGPRADPADEGEPLRAAGDGAAIMGGADTGQYHSLDDAGELDANAADEVALESSALADDELLVPGIAVRRDAGPSLFSQIIDDTGAPSGLMDGDPEGAGADATLETLDDTYAMDTRPEDVPTGPMDRLEYGYGYSSYGTYTSSPAAGEVESESEPGEAEVEPEVIERADSGRPYGGVYDAEADGWA